MAGLRIESDPDRVAPGLERSGGPLPNLTSNRQTEINLRVQVFPSDFCKQLLERYFLSFNGRRDDFPFGNRQVQHCSFLHIGVLSQWLGNSNSQAVSPLLNSNMHQCTSSLFLQ